MSAFIRGLKMPERREDCPMCRELKCADTYGCGCMATMMIRPVGCYSRPDYCPLFEVPVPHGRLIDADALANDGWTLRKEVLSMGGFAIHELPLKNETIPTIIPAEEAR